jgi:AraC-like DNA-binding protein
MRAVSAQPTVLARLAAPLLHVCGEIGGSKLATELAERFELTPELLRDPEARIPLPRFYKLLEHATTKAGDPALGWRYSIELEPEAMGLLGFMAVTAPNFGTVLDRMLRYQHLMSEGERMTSERVDGCLRVRMDMWGPGRPAHRIWAEAAFIDVVVNGRKLVERHFDVREVRLRHPRHAGAERLAELLGCPLRFDAEDYAIEIPLEVLELPIVSADPAMFEYFDREAARRSESLDGEADDLLTRIARAIEQSLPEGVPTIAEVAERLHTSSRTVQRRLQDRGTSLRALVDERREQLARRYLAEGLSIAEISFLLGFSEPSAFHRAFRRWTGSTPSEWRSRRRD